MSEVQQQLPYALRCYIAEQKTRIINGNQADNRPTYPAELDRCQTDCVAWFRAGEQLVASISAENLGRCMKLFKIEHQREPYLNELWRTGVVSNQSMLLPPHVTLLARMRQLREAIA